MIAKRDEWRSKEQETPEQERERLLKQVKHDNQESSSLERRYIHTAPVITVMNTMVETMFLSISE